MGFPPGLFISLSDKRGKEGPNRWSFLWQPHGRVSSRTEMLAGASWRSLQLTFSFQEDGEFHWVHLSSTECSLLNLGPQGPEARDGLPLQTSFITPPPWAGQCYVWRHQPLACRIW
ncbi:hypothetical protein TNCT_493261 [Trichonephila clavata]|uniref:Uncharacterized protein n=1 Tax=Trichonephila clavata TaxID=2740835 RepID=A0A8X6FJ29_TRICU|nr:hypothetical protein TNCT_493261 [Trichonephila clavata]